MTFRTQIGAMLTPDYTDHRTACNILLHSAERFMRCGYTRIHEALPFWAQPSRDEYTQRI